MSNNFKWLNKQFSDLWISRCRELYQEVEKTKIAKELHMKYIITPEQLKEYYIDKFPWLLEMPMYDPTKESVVFFRFNGSDKELNKFEVHKDPTEAYANVNVPVYNCTHETRTIWVEPIEEEIESWEYRAGSKLDPNKEETFSNHLRSEYKEIETQYITDRCCLFKGDVWHKVIVDHKRDEWRIMAKFWSMGNNWEELQKTFSNDLDLNYDNSILTA